jgi:hypothetical protein
MQDLEAQLRRIVAENEEFIAMLRAVRRVAPPDWCIGGGTIRALAWDSLHSRSGWQVPKDIDIPYFDSNDLSQDAERAYEAQLRELNPALPWDVSNQARVHLWYGEYFGYEVPPFPSIQEAVATWSEYAHCVSVRLAQDDHIDIVAPFGLEDLFSMTIRRNPARISRADYRARTESKRYAERWPRVTVIGE